MTKTLTLGIAGAILAGCAAGHATRQMSDWGEVADGLQLRISAPGLIEQGMELEVDVELRCGPGRVPEGIRKLNTFTIADDLTLSLSRIEHEEFKVRPHDWTHGMTVIDTGTEAKPLDGSPLKSWKISFPLLTAGLPPDPAYTCRVELSSPGKSRFWRGKEGEWEAAGFWRGRAFSGIFHLQVLKETPKTPTFQVPVRLRLAKGEHGPVITYGPEDAVEVKLPVRNGFSLGARTDRNGGGTSLGGTRPLAPPSDPRPLDQLYGYKGGDVDRTYRLELFETSVPPQHMWDPGNGDYRVLWKREFRVRFTEDEIRKVMESKR